MKDEQMLEVRIESQDPQVIAEIESALAEVNAKRWEKTRDLVTILTVTSSVVTLVNALLDLKKRMEKKRSAPKVIVLNVDRKQLAVNEATEASLSELIKAGQS
jgi:hypothetical protein